MRFSRCILASLTTMSNPPKLLVLFVHSNMWHDLPMRICWYYRLSGETYIVYILDRKLCFTC